MEIRQQDVAAGVWWRPGWWARDARWMAGVAVLLAFVGHLAYGAVLPKTALTLAFAGSVLLAVAAINSRVMREADRVQDLTLPGGLFALVLLFGVLSLTPASPGGPHPVWAYVGISPGSGTLDRSQTLLELLKLVGLATFFGLGWVIASADSRARAAIHTTLALGAIVAAWSFLEWAGGAAGVGRQRLEGPFKAANTAGTLFGYLLVLAVGSATSTLQSARSRHRLSATAPHAAAAALFLFCLLATASRGGFLATAAALTAFVLLQLANRQTRWSRVMIGLLLGVGALAAAIIAGGDLLVRRLIEDDLTANDRREIFLAHWQTFKGAPLMGYGLGTFDTVNRLLLDALNMRDIWNVRAAHNVYLTWLQQAGLLGAIPMFGSVAAVILLAVRNTLRRSRMTTLLFAVIAASFVFLVHGLTDFALETYSMAAMWSLMLGLQLSASRGTRR